MGRVIVVASGKGGVGKTTIAASLGVVLAKNNQRVCLVDGDLGLNNLDLAMGLENRVVYDIMDILSGDCRLSQGLIKDPTLSNLNLLACTKPDAVRCVSKGDFCGLINDLATIFDFVIIDSPSGIEFSFERAILPAGEMLVVVTPDVLALKDAKRAIEKAAAVNIKNIYVVVNKIKKKLIKKREIPTNKDISSLLKAPVIGQIYESTGLALGYNLKSIYKLESELFASFGGLAQNIYYNRQ